MIGPSGRQRASDLPDAVVFSLHTRMARRAAWQRRLVRASLGALLASVITLALGWPLWQQIGGLAAGFLAGLALPVRGQLAGALERIREQSGLSYETALESATGAGPFGLADDVRRRARLTTRDVRSQRASPWWLPALAAAIALLLLPIAGTGTGNRAAGPATPPPPADSGTTDQTGNSVPDAPPPPPPPDRAQTPSADAAGAQRPGDVPEQTADEGRAGGLTDQQALSQYLQGLRERPAGDAGADAANEADGAQAQGGNPNLPADRRTEAPTAPGTQGARQESAGQGEGQDASSGADRTAGAGRPERTGEAGSRQAEQGDAQAATPDAAAEAAAEGASQASGEAGQGEAGNAEDGLQAGQRGVDEGVGAGSQPGQAVGSEGIGITGQVSQPEFLEGVLRPGPESRGGSIRLPGSTDVQLPPGTSTDTYTRAAEQALTEGNVPLEYQEIIRRYFR